MKTVDTNASSFCLLTVLKKISKSIERKFKIEKTVLMET